MLTNALLHVCHANLMSHRMKLEIEKKIFFGSVTKLSDANHDKFNSESNIITV